MKKVFVKSSLPTDQELIYATQLFDQLKYLKIIDPTTCTKITQALSNRLTLDNLVKIAQQYQLPLAHATNIYKSKIMALENHALGWTPFTSLLLEQLPQAVTGMTLKAKNPYFDTKIDHIDPYSLQNDQMGMLQEKMWRVLKPIITAKIKQTHFDLSDQDALKIGCKKFIQQQQKRSRRKELWFNQFASVAAGFTSFTLTWQWAWHLGEQLMPKTPLIRMMIAVVVLPLRFIQSSLLALTVPIIVRLMAYTNFIPILSYSTLANGNIPHKATLSIEGTTVISMGMPCITRPNTSDIGAQVLINPLFEQHLQSIEPKSFLYVCLLENKIQEVKNIEALRNLEAKCQNYYFIQMPPHAEIMHIEKELLKSFTVESLQSNMKKKVAEKMIRLILDNQSNYFISPKVKAAFGKDDDFMMAVEKLVYTAISLVHFDQNNLPGLIHHINAKLTDTIRKTVKAKELCTVCKDGMDRGYAFQQNLAKSLNCSLGENSSRAAIVAGRPINNNVKTIEEYKNFCVTPQAQHLTGSTSLNAKTETPAVRSTQPESPGQSLEQSAIQKRRT